MFLEEFALDNFIHGSNLLFLELLRGNARVKVMKQLTVMKMKQTMEISICEMGKKGNHKKLNRCAA